MKLPSIFLGRCRQREGAAGPSTCSVRKSTPGRPARRSLFSIIEKIAQTAPARDAAGHIVVTGLSTVPPAGSDGAEEASRKPRELRADQARLCGADRRLVSLAEAAAEAAVLSLLRAMR